MSIIEKLKKDITDLELRKSVQENNLKTEVKTTLDNLRPLKIIKTIISEIKNEDIIKALKYASGEVLKKLVSLIKNPFKNSI